MEVEDIPTASNVTVQNADQCTSVCDSTAGQQVDVIHADGHDLSMITFACRQQFLMKMSQTIIPSGRKQAPQTLNRAVSLAASGSFHLLNRDSNPTKR